MPLSIIFTIMNCRLMQRHALPGDKGPEFDSGLSRSGLVIWPADQMPVEPIARQLATPTGDVS